jgi:hypothetical protein
MTPRAIVQGALEAGLDMIAICDHNTAGNAAAVIEAAAGRIAVLAGMEITTSEEVHVIGLFPNQEMAEIVGRAVRETLPPYPGKPRGDDAQLLLDAEDRVLGIEPKMLSMASGFALAAAVALIRVHNGLAIASHVDRPSFSVSSQLGAFPEGVRFDAIEISAPGLRAGRQAEFAGLGIPMVASSDSHFPWDIGACRTIFEMCAATFDELALALRGAAGRRCCLA